MRKTALAIAFFGSLLLMGPRVSAQGLQTLVDIDRFLNDALWFTDAFISPATDAAVYQASSGWVETPQKCKLWDFRVAVHANAFFVPKANRSFTISNSQFSFFEIEDGRNSAVVPTALGNDDQLFLVGYINDGQNDNEVRIKTPEGIDKRVVTYPYLQASLGLWLGTEIIGKYSYKVNLKHGFYQVYGGGIKHNLSQYAKALEANGIALSLFAGYSNEEISFDFLTGGNGQYGDLGIDQIAGLVDTYQLQLNGSKKWFKLEAMAALIANQSDIEYKVNGNESASEFGLPVKRLINDRLVGIYKRRTNIIGEISGRYQFASHLFAQAAFAFGKYANANASVQFEL